MHFKDFHRLNQTSILLKLNAVLDAPLHTNLLWPAIILWLLILGTQSAYAAPANDAFANKTSISSQPNGSVSANNIDATTEINEPELLASNTNSTVWWNWTAPASGSLVVDTIGSDFDTTLTIFSGSLLSNISSLAFNDDYSGFVSRISIQVVQGTNYHFRVGGFDASQGNIVLNWSLAQTTAITAQPPVSGGQYHTCALSNDDTVKCWGYNAFGQLGNGSNTDASLPVNVVGLNAGVKAVTSGAYFSCALNRNIDNTNSAVQCWGNNASGQLGNGTTIDSSSPVTISGLTAETVTISTGNQHACAVDNTGALQCWGNNVAGQLGNGLTTSSNNPVNVNGLASGVTAVTAGYLHTCALTTTGGVKCWGSNSFGQLGNATFANATTPQDVTGLTNNVVAIQAGSYHTCALTVTGQVSCWGNNSNGQLGTGVGANTVSNIPLNVAGLSNGIAALAAGHQHSCALSNNKQLQCWGSNGFGQLGNGAIADSPTPVAIAGDNNNYTAINAGAYHTCALDSLGEVQCWGFNNFGALGNGSLVTSSLPVTVSNLNLSRLSQTIDFPSIADQLFTSATFDISATASSGLTVSFRATTPLACSVLGNTVTLLNVGTCTITAEQAGNATYSPAGEFSRSFNITLPPPPPLAEDGEVPLPNWVLLLMSSCLLACILRAKRS